MRLQFGKLALQMDQPLFQQDRLVLGEVGVQGIAAVAQRLCFRRNPPMLLAIGDDGRKARNLGLGFQDRLVSAVEVVEVMHKRLDALFDRERLQHVLTDEISQVSDRLHGHRLMKQIQRLIVLDAKAPAKRRRVGRKRVEKLGLGQAAQALA